MTVHVFCTNIVHIMYRFLDISPDMSKMSFLTLKITFKVSQNEPSRIFPTLKMTFRWIPSNPSLHSSLLPSWESSKAENKLLQIC